MFQHGFNMFQYVSTCFNHPFGGAAFRNHPPYVQWSTILYLYGGYVIQRIRFQRERLRHIESASSVQLTSLVSKSETVLDTHRQVETPRIHRIPRSHAPGSWWILYIFCAATFSAVKLNCWAGLKKSTAAHRLPSDGSNYTQPLPSQSN